MDPLGFVERALQSPDFLENHRVAFEDVALDPSSEMKWEEHQGEQDGNLVMEENAAYLVKDPEDAAVELSQALHQAGHQRNEGFQVELLLEHQVDYQGDPHYVGHQGMDLLLDFQGERL